MGIASDFRNHRHWHWRSRSSNGIEGGYRLPAEVPQPLSLAEADRGEYYQYLRGISSAGKPAKTRTFYRESLSYTCCITKSFWTCHYCWWKNDNVPAYGARYTRRAQSPRRLSRTTPHAIVTFTRKRWLACHATRARKERCRAGSQSSNAFTPGEKLWGGGDDNTGSRFR